MQLTADCPVAIPLLLGIWCEADADGAFAWNPPALKARYLSAVSEDPGELLEALGALNFIRRLEGSGRLIGLVRDLAWRRRKSPEPSRSQAAKIRASKFSVSVEPER